MTNRMPVRRGSWLARSVAGVLSAAAVFAISASPANAGTYRVYTCKTPGNVPTSSVGWEDFGFNATPGQWNTNSCSSAGSLDTNMNGDPLYGNTWKAWKWTAPANTTIAGASVRFAMASNYHGGDATAGPGWWAFKDAPQYDGSHVLRICNVGDGCTGLNESFGVPGGSTAFGVVAGCVGSQYGVCGGGNRLESHIYYGIVDLEDAANPTVTGTSGTVLENRNLAGNESLAWTATDVGGGIWESEVKIGGTVVVPRGTVDGNGGRCGLIEGGFGWPVPCKLSAAQSLNVDTTKVPDGTYTLTATVWDAANNPSTIASRRVTIDNVPPPGIKPVPASAADPKANDPRVEGEARVGALLTAFDGNWNDASAQLTRVWQQADTAEGPWTTVPASVGPTYRPNALLSGKFVRIAVTAVSKEGTTTVNSAARGIDQASGGSLALLTSNNGTGGDPATGLLKPSKKRTKATVGFKKTIKLAGTLVDGAGKPIVGGQIDAYETVAPSGTRTKVATITSDAKGRYSWAPTTRSNRVVDLGYSRQKGSDNYQSTQSLQVLVRAGITIKLKRTRISSYGTGVITGRVVVDGFPADGVRVEVFAIGSKNRSGGTVRTDGNGRFTWRYRYQRVRRGTVALFVKVHRDRNMPAVESKSNIVRQRIG